MKTLSTAIIAAVIATTSVAAPAVAVTLKGDVRITPSLILTAKGVASLHLFSGEYVAIDDLQVKPTRLQGMDAPTFGEAGWTLFALIVEKDGTVHEMKVLAARCENPDSSKYTAAMERWIAFHHPCFRPGMIDGKPVRTLMLTRCTTGADSESPISWAPWPPPALLSVLQTRSLVTK